MLVIVGFVLISLLYFIAYNVLTSTGLTVAKAPYQELFRYQLKKAEESNAEIIFVGDSSLGNSIDARLFSALSKKTVENYALTGSFGFKGSLYMLKKTNHPKLESVVIMQSIDMFVRDIAKDHTPSKMWLGLDFSIYNFTILKSFVRQLVEYVFARSVVEEKHILTNDYISQGPPKAQNFIYDSIKISEINRDKIEYLRAISVYCNQNSFNCIYSHGPIVHDVCVSSRAYIQSINKIIVGLGLRLASDDPVCIPKSELGDSKDHVHPIYKEDYTRIFFEVLNEYF